MVNPDGSPRVVYHGTYNLEKPQHFTKFRVDRDLGAHFAEDPGLANLFALEEDPEISSEAFDSFSARVYPVYLSIKKPLFLPDIGQWDQYNYWLETMSRFLATRAQRFSPDVKKIMSCLFYFSRDNNIEPSGEDIKKAIKAFGYDGIYYLNECEEAPSGNTTCWIAFDQKQIKSVFNIGRFSRRSADIRNPYERL